MGIIIKSILSSLAEIFFFKQKTAYEIKECDWSSDVCSSDLSVDLACVAKDFHALVDSDLYLPEDSWDKDRTR